MCAARLGEQGASLLIGDYIILLHKWLWWPSSLERVSNSSRHSLQDSGLNPRSGLRYQSLKNRNPLSQFKYQGAG